MWRFVAIAAVLCVAVPAEARQGRSDRDELQALVMEFTRLEDAGDMQAQSKITAPDRWWHGPGGRRTDNAMWMKVQEDNIAATRVRFPGLKTTREVRDLQIRLIGTTAAVTSFTWFFNRVVPGDMTSERRAALGPLVPVTVSHVWSKGADGWKIVSTHQSPQYVLP
jgi:Domain of unknown function (DUF4440)